MASQTPIAGRKWHPISARERMMKSEKEHQRICVGAEKVAIRNKATLQRPASAATPRAWKHMASRKIRATLSGASWESAK
jgi:hypothetical protein